MARIVKNPNQTQSMALYEYPGDDVVVGSQPGTANFIPCHKINFDKDNGYAFSDDKNMDRVVNYFVKQKGFTLEKKKKE